MSATTANPAAVQQSEIAKQLDMVKHQQDLIRTGQYEMLGPIWVITVEAAQNAAVPSLAVTRSVGVRLDFPGDGKPSGPRLAQSKCVHCKTLLLLDPIRRKDGTVGLEDITDPDWIPPNHYPTESETMGLDTYVPPVGPKIPQYLRDRARGQWPKGVGEFLCFSPIFQVLFRLLEPVAGDRNAPSAYTMGPDGWMAECKGDREGRQTELIVSTKTGEGYFLYGNYDIFRCG